MPARHVNTMRTQLIRPIVAGIGALAAAATLLVGLAAQQRASSITAEQLLAGHPEVAAGGELDLLPALIASELLPFPESLTTTPRATLERLADGYRDKLAALSAGAAFVTDKRPDNFLVGLCQRIIAFAPMCNSQVSRNLLL